MERRDRLAVVYLVVALAASVVLGLAIAYLEVRRSEEMVQVEMRWLGEIERLQREVDKIREEFYNVSKDLNKSIADKLESGSSRSSRPAAEDDGDEYYYDDYDPEEDEDAAEEGKPETPARTKREVRGTVSRALKPYNLILRQPFKTLANRTGPLEVKAKILVNSENTAGYAILQPEPEKPKGNCGNVAAHYVGDTTRIRHGRSHCYDMNSRMCHVEGLFRDWIPAQWSTSSSDNCVTLRDGHFILNKSPGIYYLYSQIFYADNHDTNGYRIYINGHPAFQCTVTGLHDHHWIPNRVPYKKNSCYTGGLVRLNAGDRIMIKEIDNVERYSVFEPYKSYFGFFKVFGDQSKKRRR